MIDNLDNTNLIKQNLRKKFASIYDCTSLADCVVKSKQATNIHTIIDGMKRHKQTIMHNYASSNSEEIRDRHVEPFAFTTNYIQIWCYDLEDKQNKLFNTARIESVDVLENDWIATDKHVKGYIDIFRFSNYVQIPVKLILGVKSHNLLIEEYPLSERDLSVYDNNHWLLNTKVCDYRGILRFYLGLADDIIIIDSPNFKKYINNYINDNLLK